MFKICWSVTDLCLDDCDCEAAGDKVVFYLQQRVVISPGSVQALSCFLFKYNKVKIMREGNPNSQSS